MLFPRECPPGKSQSSRYPLELLRSHLVREAFPTGVCLAVLPALGPLLCPVASDFSRPSLCPLLPQSICFLIHPLVAEPPSPGCGLRPCSLARSLCPPNPAWAQPPSPGAGPSMLYQWQESSFL